MFLIISLSNNFRNYYWRKFVQLLNLGTVIRDFHVLACRCAMRRPQEWRIRKSNWPLHRCNNGQNSSVFVTGGNDRFWRLSRSAVAPVSQLITLSAKLKAVVSWWFGIITPPFHSCPRTEWSHSLLSSPLALQMGSSNVFTHRDSQSSFLPFTRNPLFVSISERERKLLYSVSEQK